MSRKIVVECEGEPDVEFEISDEAAATFDALAEAEGIAPAELMERLLLDAARASTGR